MTAAQLTGHSPVTLVDTLLPAPGGRTRVRDVISKQIRTALRRARRPVVLDLVLGLVCRFAFHWTWTNTAAMTGAFALASVSATGQLPQLTRPCPQNRPPLGNSRGLSPRRPSGRRAVRSPAITNLHERRVRDDAVRDCRSANACG